jgi:predicted AlkP superfamily pyrophosphatase or phosphodiesterase
MKRPGTVDLLVLVDALGWEILKTRSFLNDILVQRHRIETILGYSSGAIPTLLTGTLPDRHGHWNLFYYSPKTSPFRWTAPLMLLAGGLRESRVVRKLVQEISRRVAGYTGYFAIYNLPLDRIRHFDICETSNIYEPGGLAPATSLFDLLKSRGVPYHCYTYHRYSDTETLDLVPQHLMKGGSRVYFLYLSGLDAYLHEHVHDQAGVTERLSWYEDRLRRIWRAASDCWQNVRLTVFSDHGMTPTRRTVDLMREMNQLQLCVPTDYLPAYDATMARFWLFSRQAEAGLRGLLDRQDFGRILSRDELRELGTEFADGRYGHLVFVMKPGVLICPSDMGRMPFMGMHGFHPRDDPDSYAVFLSSQHRPNPPQHIAQVLPFLRANLDLS